MLLFITTFGLETR